MSQYVLSETGHAVAAVAKCLSVADPTFYSQLDTAIRGSGMFTTDEKLSLFTVIRQEAGNIGSAERQAGGIATGLMTNVLTSDFAKYDLPPDIAPVVDDVLRLKIMLVVKALLIGGIDAQIAGLTAMKAGLEATDDVDLINLLRVDNSLPGGV